MLVIYQLIIIFTYFTNFKYFYTIKKDQQIYFLFIIFNKQSKSLPLNLCRKFHTTINNRRAGATYSKI